MCHRYNLSLLVSTGAVSCYPAPIVKIWFIHNKFLKFYSYSYNNVQSDHIYASVGIVRLSRVQARQCTSTPILREGWVFRSRGARFHVHMLPSADTINIFLLANQVKFTIEAG